MVLCNQLKHGYLLFLADPVGAVRRARDSAPPPRSTMDRNG